MLADPEILQRLRPASGLAELHLRVPPTLPYFTDHFAAHPILPGVVQLGWAVRYAQAEFAIAGTFRRLDVLKFQHPIAPGDELLLRLQQRGAQAVEFSYTCAADAGAAAQRLYSSGRLGFADAAL